MTELEKSWLLFSAQFNNNRESPGVLDRLRRAFYAGFAAGEREEKRRHRP